MTDKSDYTHECAMCGTPGNLDDPCPSCGPRPKKVVRQYTLTEFSTMDDAKRDEIQRKGRPSGAAPKVVDFPGSL